MPSPLLAATYTNDPQNKPIDRIRLEIGDTDCERAQLSDAEINLYITIHDPDDERTDGRLLRAASECARLIAARFSSRINYSHGGVKKDGSALQEQFFRLAKRLEMEANSHSVIPEVLGVTIDEKEAADEDASRVQPDFKKGMHDNPRSGPVVTSDPNLRTTY